MPLSYRLLKVVDSTELCAYLNGASLNIDSPIIMTNSNYYDSQGMVSPNYEHHDCTISYPLYNLNCEHRNRTLPNYNKCYACLLIVPCYEKKYIIMTKN